MTTIFKATLPDTRSTLPSPRSLQTAAKRYVCYYPCPFGYYGDAERECTCSPQMITRYQKRISGPMMDRIDIHAEVPRVDYDKLASDRLGEPSEAVRERVEAAREMQRARFERAHAEGVLPAGRHLTCNADMGPAEVRVYCEVDPAGKSLLRAAMQQLHMSARAYHRILKLARTIADLSGSEAIQTQHLAEAIQYRPRRQF